MSEDELEELRKRRLMEMQQRQLQDQQQEGEQKQFEIKKQAIMRKILTPQARQRLANLKIVRPDFAAQIELQLIQISQQGKLTRPIDDDQLKEILTKLQTERREIRIRRV